MLNEVWQYEKDVLSGKIPSGKPLRLAVERNIADIKKSKKKDYPFYFDEKAAERIIKFCELCHHWKGAKARTPIILEPNQKWRLALKYGWKEKGTNHRRFRKTYEEVARKNAKTTEKALEAIAHMVYDGGIGACVVAAATKADQAKIVVNDAGKIIEATPVLKNRGFRLFKMKGKVYEIHYAPTESSMFAIGRDSDNQDGLDPSMGIIDEYHAHRDDGILNVVKSGMQARPEPMLSIITTAGFDLESPCYKVERKNALDILEGVKEDDRYFISIYTIDKEDEAQWDDPKVWIKSNPNMGASVNLQNMLSDMQDAKNKGGSTLVNFQTKNVNMWVDAPETWIESEVWAQNTEYSFIVPVEKVESMLSGRMCWGGLDLANARDFNAYVLIFEPDEETGRIPILPYIFCTEDYFKKLDERQYYEWVNDGYLILSDGNIMDPRLIWDKMKQTFEMFDIQNIAYDPHLVHKFVTTEAEEEGEHWRLSAFPQVWYNLNWGSKEFEKICYSAGSSWEVQGFEHFNNPVYKWMLSNVQINTDHNGNIRVSKKDPKKKVDAISATINALGSWEAWKNMEEPGEIRFIPDAG